MSEPKNEFKAGRFFILTLALSWGALWIAVLSGSSGLSNWSLRITAGLSPFISALIFLRLSRSDELKKDYLNRIFNFRRLKGNSLVFIFLAAPVANSLAISISLLFGGSIEQFKFSEEFITNPLFFTIFLFFFGPVPEELGWAGFGMDGLRMKFNLLSASLIFSFLWSLWHLPLFFVKGTYHNELLSYVPGTINFFVALVPVAVISFWLYYINNRSIMAAIFFHFVVNYSGELLSITPGTKIIQTVLLVTLASSIVYRNKRMFFQREIPSEMSSPIKLLVK